METELGFPRDEDPTNVQGIERRGPDAHQLADCLMQQVDLPEERWEVDLECEEPATSKGGEGAGSGVESHRRPPRQGRFKKGTYNV